MDATDTHVEPANVAVAVERRRWPRRANAQDRLTITTGTAWVAATVVDASPGGMGLDVHDASQLQIGQQVELTGDLDPIAAVVRFVVPQADGTCRVGVEWTD